MGTITKTIEEGKDFTVDDQGRLVFSRSFLIERGYCCENGCQNCPYGYFSTFETTEGEDHG